MYTRHTLGTESGFTLIELLIGIGLMAILAMIAMPQYERYLKKAKAVEAEQVLHDIERLQTGYYIETGTYATDLSALGYTPASSVPYQIAINLNPASNSGNNSSQGKGQGQSKAQNQGQGKKQDGSAAPAVYEVLATANLDNDADLDALRLTRSQDDAVVVEHGCMVGGFGTFIPGCGD